MDTDPQSKWPSLTADEIAAETSSRLKRYDGLNFFEQYAMFMGVAQLLEISLKQLLNRKFGVPFESIERSTLGQVARLLKERGLLENKHVARVAFYEITKRAIQDAISKPRELSGELINAQQARRALDYLVGFNLSPLLWRKIRRGLSAGRVQSPALRMIVERELEI